MNGNNFNLVSLDLQAIDISKEQVDRRYDHLMQLSGCNLFKWNTKGFSRSTYGRIPHLKELTFDHYKTQNNSKNYLAM